MITPDWPAPGNVRALITCRQGGASTGAYGSFNLATHVGDDPLLVRRNRQFLAAQTQVQNWQWLEQVHGVEVVEASPSQGILKADGCYTRQHDLALAVLTADCLPLLMCDQAGTQVAAVHAGWRGLAAGILTTAVNRFNNPAELLVYLGPAISQRAFEVGPEVVAAFIVLGRTFGQDWRCAFVASGRAEHYWADLYQLARLHLAALGVTHIYGGEFCTFSQTDKFYSFRREAVTGRMASVIWLAAR